MIRYKDRVRAISSEYSCAEVGEEGTIVDDGYESGSVQLADGSRYKYPRRYSVRWDSKPTMLFGVHADCIERIEE